MIKSWFRRLQKFLLGLWRGPIRKALQFLLCLWRGPIRRVLRFLLGIWPGPKGDPFTYNDFTPEQLDELKAPAVEAAERADQAAQNANDAASGVLDAKAGAESAANTAIQAANTAAEAAQNADNAREAIQDDLSAIQTQIGKNTADLSSLKGIGRISVHLGSTPAQGELTNAWEAVKGAAPTEGASIVNLDQDAPSGHVWTYFETSAGVFEWIARGIDTVGQATNDVAGIVKGSTSDLSVKVNADGTMEVVGLSEALNSKVSGATVGDTVVEKANGTLKLPAYPTTLPANGGNADTVAGKSLWFGYTDQLPAVKDTNTIYFAYKRA